MFCSKCGTLLKNTDNFCPQCGALVDTTRLTKEDVQSESKRTTINNPRPDKADLSQTKKTQAMDKNRKALAWAVIVVFLTVIIGVFIKGLSVGNTNNTGYQPAVTEDTINKFGDVVEFNGMEYVVKDCSFEEYMGGLQGLNKAKEGYCYIVLHIDVKNISNSAISTQSSVFEILYDDKYEYDLSFASYTDFYDYNDSIVALGSLEDKIINFEVPIEVRDSGKKIELVLSKNSRFDDEHVIWKLN